MLAYGELLQRRVALVSPYALYFISKMALSSTRQLCIRESRDFRLVRYSVVQKVRPFRIRRACLSTYLLETLWLSTLATMVKSNHDQST